jgi:hypothetical protein
VRGLSDIKAYCRIIGKRTGFTCARLLLHIYANRPERLASVGAWIVRMCFLPLIVFNWKGTVHAVSASDWIVSSKAYFWTCFIAITGLSSHAVYTYICFSGMILTILPVFPRSNFFCFCPPCSCPFHQSEMHCHVRDTHGGGWSRNINARYLHTLMVYL